MNSRSFQALVAGAAIVLAALVSGCGNGGSQDATTSAPNGGEPARTTVDRGTAPATEAFARLDPSAFADRMESGEGMVINVHIPYEGELAGTDAFIAFDQIVGDPRLPEDKDREILLYCRSGNMTEEAGAALHRVGYTKVAHLEGGMKAWAAAGRDLVHDPARSQ